MTFSPSHALGLTAQEAVQRKAKGLNNDIPLKSSRTYWDILRDNLFTFINGVYFFLSLVLLSLGRVSDVLVVAFIVSLNVIINIVQEIRAKRKLDSIALLTRPQATVIRDGQEQAIDLTDIVVGDLLVLKPGDQVAVDGPLVQGEVKVDESLLTGESDLVGKRGGDFVFSGSFCVSGSALYGAKKVGSESLASTMTAEAKQFRKVLTPLQRQINTLIRLLLGLAIVLGVITLLRMILGVTSLTVGIQNLVVIVGLVPIGLYFMITLTYALGAVSIAQQSALVQQANAVESISNVDIMCIDKTGTLTANRIYLQSIHPLADLREPDLRRRLGDYAASAAASNKTNDALIQAEPRDRRSVRREIPFSSVYKWSGIAFTDGPGMDILGAPEILAPALPDPGLVKDIIAAGAAQGLRVLLFAHSATEVDQEDDAGNPRLPSLQPLAVLYFGDELREGVHQTLGEFRQAAVQVKVISGDNPDTVAALAKQAGLGDDILAISGQDLAHLDDASFAQAAEDNTIFGRITPEQKAKLVASLQDRGHYVAMMGDGVNDVLSLKQANVGVAMESGSQATRSVADIVLLKDSFSALPKIFLEGQRIRNGVEDITKLFMVRIFAFAMVIVAISMVTLSFPLGIKTGTLVTFFIAGIPPFFVTLWAKPQRHTYDQGDPFLHFVLPATLTLSLASIVLYLIFLADNVGPILDWLTGHISLEVAASQISRADIIRAQQVAESGLVTLQILGGLLLLIFLKPPTRFWTGGAPLSRDWRFTALAAVLLGAYGVVLAVPALRSFFDLYPLYPITQAGIGLGAIIWALVLRFTWRHKLLDRFLGTTISPFS